jgi:hypothetical protein
MERGGVTNVKVNRGVDFRPEEREMERGGVAKEIQYFLRPNFLCHERLTRFPLRGARVYLGIDPRTSKDLPGGF